MQTRQTTLDNLDSIRTTSGWLMNQMSPPELLVHPHHALLFGVDGNNADALRRFRGFKRLDFDIREFSRAGLCSMVRSGSPRYASDLTFNGMSSHRVYSSHLWDGLGDNDEINTDGTQLLQFRAVTFERIGRSNSNAGTDRRVIAGFVFHFKKGGENVVKFIGRSLGDTTLSAMYQCGLFGSQAVEGWYGTSEGSLPTYYVITGDIRFGIVGLGRALYLAFRDGLTGGAWSFRSPIAAFSGWHRESGTLAVRLPTTDYFLNNLVTGIKSGFVEPGDKYLSTRYAGGRTQLPGQLGPTSWVWPLLVSTAVWEEAGTVDGLSFVYNKGGNAKARLRVRFFNKTTGTAGQMSDPLDIQASELGPYGRGSFKKYKYYLLNLGTANAADVTLVQSVVSIFQLAGLEGDLKVTKTWPSNPFVTNGTDTMSAIRDDLVLQVWLTLSVPSDNPSGGLGYYFLDAEYPIAIQNLVQGNPAQSVISPVAFVPGQKDDNQLFRSVVYVPEQDDLPSIAPCVALGAVEGLLLSLSDGRIDSGSTRADDMDIYGELNTIDDIRVSPPWKFDNSGWLEHVASLTRFVVQPKGLVHPSFVPVGSFVFYVSQNKLVRIVRDGSGIIMDDVDISGLVSHDSCAGAESRLFLVLGTDFVEVDPVTLQKIPHTFLHNLIYDKWSKFVREGRIMCGYDPQLNAVFIAPRRALSSTTWERNEAAVVWLNTGAITMLSDVYWTGMSRGVHPVTGKEHLFFVDPAFNITYADDTKDTSSTAPATMTGVNRFVHPNASHREAVYLFTLTDNTGLTGAVFMFDGVPFREGVGKEWIVGATTAATVANLKVALDQWKGLHTAFNYASSTVVSNALTITTSLKGSEANKFVSADAHYYAPGLYSSIGLRQSNNYTLSRTQSPEGPAEDDPATSKFGGVVDGVITQVSSSLGVTTVTNGNMTISNIGWFDRYGHYDPFLAYPESSSGNTRRFGALLGSQVYFFREVSGLPVLVADARVKSNTHNQLLFNDSEINFYPGFTSLAVNDTFTISPVVFQMVGAPYMSGDVPGANLDNAVSCEAVGCYLRRKHGKATNGAIRYPNSAPPHSALFLQNCTPADLEARAVGTVLRPSVGVGKSKTVATQTGAVQSIWDNDTNLISSPTGDRRQLLMPVVTCYGTDYQFDLVAVISQVAREGVVAGDKPEGVD